MRQTILILLLFTFAVQAKAQTPSYESSLAEYRQAKKEHFLKDNFGPLRAENVQYVNYFPANSKYIVDADLQLLYGEKEFRMPTYDGTSNPYKRYARITFTIDGETQQLTLYQSVALFQNPNYANYLFLPFTDKSSGNESYEGGRYLELDATAISNHKIRVDFNKAYNPYCAYSSGYRCPQPPVENNLQISILAGEKKYKGPKNERPVNTAMAKGFTEKEKALITAGDNTEKLHVYQITDAKERAVLQSSSTDIKADDPLVATLAQRMLATVQDPAHPGVGIAAPQVGINRNLIWVQRFDKKDEPFEFYINPKIIWRSKLTREGAEGCLSIPDKKENVERSYAIRLQYWDTKGNIIEENIEGFTAVIFQHEVDHLYGILFPDRIEEQVAENQIPLNEKIKFSVGKGTLIP
ncbi:peptide deformylase [Sphingobacterium sp. Mn56C]|uniref:peptide deformylase n=1 Tax=Sphingobacterium sp. Mn56C TaxID=3395261 RepID=UPI003BCF5DE1